MQVINVTTKDYTNGAPSDITLLIKSRDNDLFRVRYISTIKDLKNNITYINSEDFKFKFSVHNLTLENQIKELSDFSTKFLEKLYYDNTENITRVITTKTLLFINKWYNKIRSKI